MKTIEKDEQNNEKNGITRVTIGKKGDLSPCERGKRVFVLLSVSLGLRQYALFPKRAAMRANVPVFVTPAKA